MQANLLAALADAPEAVNQVYNVAVGDGRASPNCSALLRELLTQLVPMFAAAEVIHEAFRPGDVRHSQADIAKAAHSSAIGRVTGLARGLAAMPWYLGSVERQITMGGAWTAFAAFQRGTERTPRRSKSAATSASRPSRR